MLPAVFLAGVFATLTRPTKATDTELRCPSTFQMSL
jgi:hypothetical protein